MDIPTALIWMDGIFGILAGLFYLWNARRTTTDMDIRKRGLRILKGLSMLSIGVGYLLIALDIFDLTTDYTVLAVRSPLWVLFAAALGYAFIER